MKTRIYISIISLCLALASTSIAAVITGTNIVLGDGSFVGADYALTVYQDEAATDPTGVFFDLSGSTMMFVTSTLDEASDWFLTLQGEEFSESSISGAAHPILIRHTPTSFETNALDVGFGDFYLGVNTGNVDGVGFPPRNLYGWAKLNNTGGNLTMLDNAMAYQGSGIITGTTEVVPEPSSFALLAGGVALLSAFKSRRRQNRVRGSL